MESITRKIKIDDVIYENEIAVAKSVSEKHKINIFDFCDRYMLIAKKHEIEIETGNIITTMELRRK